MKSINNTQTMIFVDLDGSLVQADILFESILLLIKKNLFYIVLLPVWLIKGKAHLKQMIAERVNIDVSTLPYHDGLLSYLDSEFKCKTPIYLATASNIIFAEQVADHLGIFTDVIASDTRENISGRKKLCEIHKISGSRPFIYAGNAKVDIPIWQCADACIVVNASKNVKKRVKSQCQVSHIFNGDQKRIALWLKAIRIHQWLKNILLFVPLLAAHQISNSYLLFQSFLGFMAFCLCSSSVYIMNDLFDLQSDRSHPTKKNRPFAAGTLHPFQGILLASFFLFASFVISYFLPIEFFMILVTYYLLTCSYSLFLKQLALVDVITLSCLYVIRIVAGSVATCISLSFWLLTFSMFIFFSLALVKRVSELNTMKELDRIDITGRGYFVSDLEYLHSMGVASGYIAVLVLAFYINSEKVVAFYETPEILCLAFPLVLYWISRIWLKAGRGEVHDDPVVFAFRDPQSLLVAGILLTVILVATFIQF